MISTASKNSTKPRSTKARKLEGIDRLHPAVRAWFLERYGKLSDIQARALPHTLCGENTLILAPTGSGKTFAAFLSVLSQLFARAMENRLPNAVCAVYISPLKALDTDIHRNLSPILDALNAMLPAKQQILMEVRTGDTALTERARQQRRKPHLLMTTPESLSSLLSQAAWRKEGFQPETVIVDEIHSFAENKRGSLLSLSLERLEHRSPQAMQRIGISATAWPISAIQKLLCGDRPSAVAQVDVAKSHRLEIVAPAPDEWLPPAGWGPFRISPTVARQVQAAQCSLIFLTTRSGVERLGLALKILLPEWDEKIAVHHGSVDRETRIDIEQGLKDGIWKAVVASSSLELGVDFSSVDQVLLIGTPRGVSRGLQRLGRSGHRVDGVASGALVPLSLPDLVECVALREAVKHGHLDSLRVPGAPLDVLAQVLLGMSLERSWPVEEAFTLVRRSGVYADLSKQDFDAVLEYLSGAGRVLGPYGTYGKITLENGHFQVAGKKIARDYYMNVGVISDEHQFRIVSSRNRWMGEVAEGFITSLQPGEAFTIGGRTVRISKIHQNTAIVEPAQGEQVKTPRWLGNKMPLTAQLAREELAIRQELRSAWEMGQEKACVTRLQSNYGVDENVASRIAGFIARHNRAMPVPTASPVLIERLIEGRSMLLVVHVVAGRAVNRSLAWVAGWRIAKGQSVVANFDDHTFLLSLDAGIEVNADNLRAMFNPEHWMEDLRHVISTTEALGRSFRHIAEIGQLLPRKTLHGRVPAKASSWSGDLLYKTLQEHEPDHPLVREAVREVMEDQCDARQAYQEVQRIFTCPIELYDLPRPSPFGLPLFTAFNREVLVAPDPEKALDDLIKDLYEEWQ